MVVFLYKYNGREGRINARSASFYRGQDLSLSRMTEKKVRKADVKECIRLSTECQSVDQLPIMHKKEKLGVNKS